MKPFFLFLASLACGVHVEAQNTSAIAVSSQTPAAYSAVDQMPEFPGGTGEQMSYISKNIRYPQIAMNSAYSGTSYIKFTIDTAGYIKDAKVLKGVPHCPECDQEALRVIKAMPRWKPGKQNGKAVNVYYNLPVRFRLQ